MLKNKNCLIYVKFRPTGKAEANSQSSMKVTLWRVRNDKDGKQHANTIEVMNVVQKKYADNVRPSRQDKIKVRLSNSNKKTLHFDEH